MANEYESDASIGAMSAMGGMNDFGAIGIMSSESGISGISDVSGVSDGTGSSATPSVSSAESALTPSFTPSGTPSATPSASVTPSATPSATPSEAPLPRRKRTIPPRPRTTAPRRKIPQEIVPRRWVTEKKLKVTNNPVADDSERYKMWYFVPVQTFPHTLVFTYALHMVVCIYLGFLTFFCVIFFFNMFILAAVFSRKRSWSLVAAIPASVIYFMYGLHMVTHIPVRSRPSEWPAPTARNCFALFLFNILGSYSFLVLAGFIPMTKKKPLITTEKSPKPLAPAKPEKPVEPQKQEKQEKPETAEKKPMKPKPRRRQKKPVGGPKIFY